MSTKVKYLAWAATRWLLTDRACPGCGAPETVLLKRKHLVTALYRCTACELMFRVPKGSAVADEEFYESEYQQESTTELPDQVTLSRLKRASFESIGKDYRPRIDILRALGIEPPATVYDFGASWGYGSWQMRQSGYRVFSYEIAASRARFAREQLACVCLESPYAVPEQVDCLFASHVLEHLPDPNAFWRIAQSVLKPNGVVVVFVPNGDPRRATSAADSYHQLWGLVHPLLFSPAALTRMADRHAFGGRAYSSPYALEDIQRRVMGRLDGDELLFVAQGRAA
jgi:SAM-dependent methyltransferase